MLPSFDLLKRLLSSRRRLSKQWPQICVEICSALPLYVQRHTAQQLLALRCLARVNVCGLTTFYCSRQPERIQSALAHTAMGDRDNGRNTIACYRCPISSRYSSVHSGWRDHFVRRVETMTVALTPISSNRKTGPMPVSYSTKEWCPDDCPLKKHGCYAKHGHTGIHWRKVTAGERGTDWNTFTSKVRRIPKGGIWRHNVAGDLPVKP